MRNFALLVCSCLVCSLAVADKPKAVSDADVTVLYDGGDLTGWAGREDLWSAENGEIVGRTTAEQPTGHPAR